MYDYVGIFVVRKRAGIRMKMWELSNPHGWKMEGWTPKGYFFFITKKQ